MIKMALIFISLFASLDTSASKLTNEIARASQSQIKSIVKSMADALAKDVPAQLDNVTKAVAVNYVSSANTLIYFYEVSIKPNPEYVRTSVAGMVCTNEILRALSMRSVTFRYYYRDTNGKHLLTHDVTSGDCTNN